MLGRVFALSSDEEQAAFLNEVGRVMRTFDSATDGSGYAMQLCRISDHLDSNGRKFIKRLSEFLEVTP